MNSEKNLIVEVWSEITCPFCPVGEVNLKQGLALFSNDPEVEVIYRSFRLLPGKTPRPVTEIAVEKHGDDPLVMQRKMIAIGARVGLTYRPNNLIAGDTLDAHRLVHFTKEEGLSQQMIERLYRAHFTDEENIFDRASLIRLAVEIGLHAQDTSKMFESDRYVQAVKNDEDRARSLGIKSVPTILLNEHIVLSACEPPDRILQALKFPKAEALIAPLNGES